MKSVLGLLLCLAGIALGLYVGLYLCFIGGIVDIVNQVKANGNADAVVIAWGVARILLAGAAGKLCATLLIVPGIAMIDID